MKSSDSHLSTDPLHNGLSPFVCACFTLNYLIGTGFLTLPWAFDMSGLLLSTATMAFTCFIACAASDYILSSMARANVVAVLEEHEKAADTGANADGETNGLLVPSTNSINKSYQSVEAPSDKNVMLSTATLKTLDASASDVDEQGKLLVGERKFELTELV